SVASQPFHAGRVGAVRLLQVATGPPREPSRGGGSGTGQVVIDGGDGGGQVGMVDGRDRVAVDQRQSGPVQLDRSGQPVPLVPVNDDRPRGWPASFHLTPPCLWVLFY